MRHCPKVCHVPKPGHCDLLFTLDGTYFKIFFRFISPVLFDIGTPNLMGGCVITQRCVPVPKPGHRDLLFMLDRTYFKIPFCCISPVLFDTGTSNLMGWVCHRPKVCRVLKPGHRHLLFTLDRMYFKIPFRFISPVLFDIGDTIAWWMDVSSPKGVSHTKTRTLLPTFHAWPHLLQNSLLLHIYCSIWHRDIKLDGLDVSSPKGVSRTKTRSPWPTFHTWPHLLQNTLPLHISLLFDIGTSNLIGWMCHRPKVCQVPKPGHRDILFMLDCIVSAPNLHIFRLKMCEKFCTL